jgi:hypothetical protein
VAGIFRIFGVFTLRSFYVAVALNTVFSVLTCVPLYLAGARIAGVGTGSLSAWLWAVFPNAIIIPFQWIWDTSLSALIAAAIFWVTIVVAESRRKRDWCVYGLIWGFALMTNPALGCVLPFLLAWAAYRMRRARPGISRPLLAATVIVLCCVPWTLRNQAVFHRFILLRSNFPFELWLGNNEVFDDSSPNVNARVTRFGQRRRFLELGETAFMQEKWELAIWFIRTHKRLELRLVKWRFLKFWLGSFHPVEDFVHSDSALIRTIFLVSFLTAIAALAGLLVIWPMNRLATLPAAVFVLVFPCLYYVTHSSLRYRHPIDPIVVLLTAVAVSSVWQALTNAKKPRPAVPSPASA